MQKYRKELMSDEQKEKVKMYDRMCAAKKVLEKKLKSKLRKKIIGFENKSHGWCKKFQLPQQNSRKSLTKFVKLPIHVA